MTLGSLTRSTLNPPVAVDFQSIHQQVYRHPFAASSSHCSHTHFEAPRKTNQAAMATDGKPTLHHLNVRAIHNPSHAVTVTPGLGEPQRDRD